MKNRDFNKTIIGTFVASSIALTAASAIHANPFTANTLDSGYAQLVMAEGKCGEGKCGGKA